MKIYRASWQDSSLGQCLSWHRNKADAERALRNAIKEMQSADLPDSETITDGEPKRIDLVNIPTDRKGLCDWLNLHFTQDNG
jgi:hypothetical protein